MFVKIMIWKMIHTQTFGFINFDDYAYITDENGNLIKKVYVGVVTMDLRITKAIGTWLISAEKALDHKGWKDY